MFTLNDQLWALTQWMLEKKTQWIDCLRSVGAGTAQTCASVRMEDASASLAGAPHLCRPLRLWRQVCCCTATCRASVRASAWAQVSSYPVIYSLMNASIQPSIHPFNQFIYISIYSFITPLSLVFTQPSITPFTHLTQMSTYPSIHPSIHLSSMCFFSLSSDGTVSCQVVPMCVRVPQAVIGPWGGEVPRPCSLEGTASPLYCKV